MPELAFAIPGDLTTRSGGYLYDRRLIAAWRDAGIAVRILNWTDGFPFPSQSDLASANEALAACPDGMVVLIDGLALGAMPDIVATHAARLRLVGLVHHPLALETGHDAATRQRLIDSERRALACMRRVVTTSGHTARTLVADYGVTREAILVAPPGTEHPNLPPRVMRPGAPPTLLAVGAVIPRKGVKELVDALATLRDLAWTCRIVGALDRAPAYVARVRAGIAQHHLSNRIMLCGEREDIAAELAAADLFAHASHHEGFGMSVAEAMAAGLPIVACAGGAVVDLLADGAGILVPPGDSIALAHALRRLLPDPAARARLSIAASRAAHTLPDTAATARAVLEWLTKA